MPRQQPAIAARPAAQQQWQQQQAAQQQWTQQQMQAQQQAMQPWQQQYANVAAAYGHTGQSAVVAGTGSAGLSAGRHRMSDELAADLIEIMAETILADVEHPALRRMLESVIRKGDFQRACILKDMLNSKTSR